MRYLPLTLFKETFTLVTFLDFLTFLFLALMMFLTVTLLDTLTPLYSAVIMYALGLTLVLMFNVAYPLAFVFAL